MSWSLISGAVVSGGGPSEAYPFTLGPIDSTGGDLICVSCAAGGNAGGATITDSKGNTYSLVASGDSEIHYCQAPTVGTGHTFTMSGGSEFAPGMSVAVYSGSAATPLDQHATPSGSTQPGSITPTQDGELIVTGLDGHDGSGFTIDSGFTVATQTPFTGGQWWGSAQAYLVQGTAAAVNPTWSYGISSSIASFKPAGGGSITGTMAPQESGSDSASITGNVDVTGTLSAQEAGSDTAAVTGTVAVSGSMGPQESGTDTAAATGTVAVSGTMSPQESGADTATASGTVAVSGSMAAQESGSDVVRISEAPPIQNTVTDFIPLLRRRLR